MPSLKNFWQKQGGPLAVLAIVTLRQKSGWYCLFRDEIEGLFLSLWPSLRQRLQNLRQFMQGSPGHTYLGGMDYTAILPLWTNAGRTPQTLRGVAQLFQVNPSCESWA